MTKTLYANGGKRFLDFIGSVVALAIVSPLLLVVCAIVRYSVGSPVLFRQQRPGLQGKVFTIYKFRSLADLRDSAGHLLPDRQRVTRVGQLIRRSSIDELPELVNVLKGEMSLVGPRPLFTEYLDRYTAKQARRHEVLPGITGWAQINGRNDLMWEKRFDLDVWYVDHQSFMLDLRILAVTVWKVLRREGISQGGSVSCSVFMGTGKDTESRSM